MRLKESRRVSGYMLALDLTKQVKVSSLMIVNTLPRQVPVRKMGRESTAEINSLLVHIGN